AAWFEKSLHGHVPRSGNGHRRRSDARARGYGAVRQTAETMTAGYFAPLPPARTGVADYSATLLGALRQRGTVNVNASRADVFLYHLGNNQLHREIYRRALARPGVVVLHDAVLQHFFLGWLD